jgi:hypothetical protein
MISLSHLKLQMAASGAVPLLLQAAYATAAGIACSFNLQSARYGNAAQTRLQLQRYTHEI